MVLLLRWPLAMVSSPSHILPDQGDALGNHRFTAAPGYKARVNASCATADGYAVAWLSVLLQAVLTAVMLGTRCMHHWPAQVLLLLTSVAQHKP
jgi:hypothetical protein